MMRTNERDLMKWQPENAVSCHKNIYALLANALFNSDDRSEVLN